MKYKLKLFTEGFSREEIEDVELNFVSIKNEIFNIELQNSLTVDKDTFQRIISKPIINTLTFDNSFTKYLKKTNLPKTIALKLKFILFSLATNQYTQLPPNYRVHSIDKEISGHYVVRLNGDDSVLFKPEGKIIQVRDIASHSKRGY